MSQKKESFFWTSYSDLLTSLFFVMMVLFLLAIACMNNQMVKMKELIVKLDSLQISTQVELDKYKELNESIKKIDQRYFSYNSDFKRHTLKDVQVSFKSASSDINDLSADDREHLYHAGLAISRFMKEAKDSIPQAQYMLIVEGQSSHDWYQRNDELSYERALSLVKFWQTKGLDFYNFKAYTNCELLVSGSGFRSKFREQPDNKENYKNQRFVIHIIPKPGVLETTN